MAKNDFYGTLGVERGAGADAIKKAYRALAMKYHPDRNPDDKDAERKFKDASEAYEVLKDEDKRAAYDHFGHAAFEQGGAGGVDTHPGTGRRPEADVSDPHIVAAGCKASDDVVAGCPGDSAVAH